VQERLNTSACVIERERVEAGNGIPVVERKLLKNNHLKMGISARGGLEPDFRVLFSAVFRDVSLGNFHQGRKGGFSRKQDRGVLWRLYLQSFYMYWSFCLSTGISKIPV